MFDVDVITSWEFGGAGSNYNDVSEISINYHQTELAITISMVVLSI